MKLNLIRIHEGDGQHPNSEYIFLQALTAGNLKNLAFHVSSAHSAYFPFPSLPEVEVEKGDYLVLYTGSGKYVRAFINTGEPLHKVFLGKTDCLWTNRGISPQQLCLLPLEGVMASSRSHNQLG
ncbi:MULTISPECIES: hypothetical protein [Rufibacter]|uniref:TP-1001-like C-terminal domain-containing protein n=1 Tax=Rufibacter quisquiliarum TaxID=1549639 RepID=A0A839GCY4_9BACT|nr:MULTISPECIES: hypothetical protein [Rufibacter]MBA9077454.1 hypothetical protein [Rufibacter quisquiliarum]